jgi:N-hydroxyarylamine O-acetyltransferase
MSSDIEAYFTRIGYSGPRQPTIAMLREIVAKHPAAIPFENLDVLLGRVPPLDPGSLHDKLIRHRRGGYCFEHNTLLMSVLRTTGFEVAGLAARVRAGTPPDAIGPRTHMLLRVDLPEGPYLADVGFGSLMPAAPVALEIGHQQAAPHATLRLVPAAGEFDFQAHLGTEWCSLYRFSLQEQETVDYELANWYTATHPKSLFVSNLVVSRLDQDRRYTLLNYRFTVHRGGGSSERRTLRGAEELRDALSRFFGIEPADPADVVAAAARIEELAGEQRRDPFALGGPSAK